MLAIHGAKSGESIRPVVEVRLYRLNCKRKSGFPETAGEEFLSQVKPVFGIWAKFLVHTMKFTILVSPLVLLVVTEEGNIIYASVIEVSVADNFTALMNEVSV